MRGIRPALEQLVTALRTAGFAASVDPEQLSADTACVWVQPRTARYSTLAGDGSLVAWCYLVVPNVETTEALRLLDDALDGFLAVIDPADSDDVIDLTAAVVLPATPNPLPAYRVAVDLDL